MSATLAQCTTLASGTVTRSIDRSGGIIGLGPDTLVIPPGALKKAVTIQASIPAGASGNMVQFAPNGLVFDKPAVLLISYTNCPSVTPGLLQVVQVDNALAILRFLETTLDLGSGRVIALLQHFSNYAVAW